MEKVLCKQTRHAARKSMLLIALLIQVVYSESFAQTAHHGTVMAEEEKYAKLDLLSLKKLPSDSRWYLSFDNDLLAPKNRDQDYTYGINVAYTSSKIGELAFPRLLNRLDKNLGVSGDRHAKTLEFGLYGFTPSNVESSLPDYNDRPYASLVYLSTSSESMNWRAQTVIRSQLTLGMLGLSLVGDVQNLTHRLTNGAEAAGWQHQISDGGEPTFRYSLSRQQLVNSELDHMEFKHTLSASLGYLTEASWSVSMRAGQINTPWHSFKPELKTYAESVASQRSRVPESYFWAGVSLKSRAYNAFLQGQFRDSEVSYDHNQLRPLVVEAWAGYTHEFCHGLHINYGLRGHTSEIREGDGDRNVIWGGITIGKKLI